MNLLEKEFTHQRDKYLKYKKLNKAFAKKRTRKENTVVLDDTSDRDLSSSSEEENSPDEGGENSMTYDSESGGSDKSSNSATNTEEESWYSGCRDGFIIDKLNNNGKSKIKEHKLSYNNLDKALHEAHLLKSY